MASSPEYSSPKAAAAGDTPTANGGGVGNPPVELVLIHGLGSGAWSWYKVKCLLENSCGHKVTCLDLTSAGKDQTDPADVHTFAHYNKPLIDFLSSLPTNHKVILVGHSAGGLSLSDAINQFGCKKIKAAVFLAATMLKRGFHAPQDLKIGIPERFGGGKGDDKSSSVPAVNYEDQQQQSLLLCPLEDVVLSALLERPGPLPALASSKFEEGEDADKVPRIYIKTKYDNVLKPWQQEAMIEKWPPEDIYVMDSDHSPLLSNPIKLSGLLHKIALIYG
ncbi:methylesterase 17 [Andrographis paniculata]|uniref:methylesterase 17 n=1 Tax=Andrographis paniculata TaxID=175694 RepID=UPI0021E8D44B|nr:methylesterase 17 [Andrographis paniculata]